MAEYIYSMVRARKAVGDKLILDDVTMAFLPGAKIGMVGPNGAGKSTILKIMAGLDTPSNGEAKLTPGFSVGILMQEPELDESPTSEIPLPESETGTETPTTAWSPEATPSPPGVSAAFAAAVPASHRPPTQRVNHSPLETYLFMDQPFERV